jgi:hypothetical protein
LAVAQEKSFSRAAESLHRKRRQSGHSAPEGETASPVRRSSKDGTLTAPVLLDCATDVEFTARVPQFANTRCIAATSLGANEYTVMSLLPLIPIFRAPSHIRSKRSAPASRIPVNYRARRWIHRHVQTQ